MKVLGMFLGERLPKFEKLYADFSLTRFALGVSNGLDALVLSLKSLGMGEDDGDSPLKYLYSDSYSCIKCWSSKPALLDTRETY